MWTRKKHDYKLNPGKAFAIIKDDWCTPSMLRKLAQHPGWQDQLLPSRDPIELLKTIRKYMYETDVSVYPKFTCAMNMFRFMHIRQHDDEDIQEFVIRFKQLRDIAEQHVGKLMYMHQAMLLEKPESFATLTWTEKQKLTAIHRIE